MKKKNPSLSAILAIVLMVGISGQLFSKPRQRSIYSLDKVLFVGNIIFPHSVQTIPQISLYRGGIKINTETDNTSKKIQFTISEDKSCKEFFILIAEEIHPHVKENTVEYLKINSDQRYKFYSVELVKIKNSQETPGLDKKERYEWIITEIEPAENGRIPDDALIIVFNPDCIEALQGGTELELPKIVMKQNILEIVGGSEEKLHEKEVQFLMSSLDMNLIHTKITPEIKQDHKNKLVIAMSNPQK